MAAKYDLSIYQGSNFDLWLQYLTDGNTAVDLSNYGARMQVRRAKESVYPLIFFTKTGLTYGYTAGYTAGYSGVGGISLNINYDTTGITGGILITADPTTTSALPVGRHLYDVELTIGTTYSHKILEGRVDIIGETTR